MKLATGCAPLDELLGGGVEGGALTLVIGEAGTGKTNFCLQLACRALEQGAGKVAYVDAEGVSLERLAQIAGKNASKIAKHILFFSPRSLSEQEKMIKSLAKIATPRLIIVDSLNLYYRLSLAEAGANGQSGKSLTNMLGELLRLTRNEDVPIVVTGQVYSAEEGPLAFGGKVMEHIVKAIVRFEKIGPGARRATLLKHRSLPEARSADFFLTEEGLSASNL